MAASSPVFLPGESHGQSFSSWGRKQSDTTEPVDNNNSHTYKRFLITHTKMFPPPTLQPMTGWHGVEKAYPLA